MSTLRGDRKVGHESNATASGEESGSGALRSANDELMASLLPAVHEAVARLDGVTAAVHLLDEEGRELRGAMIGGGLPAALTLPGRLPLDSPHATARAFVSAEAALMPDDSGELRDPDPMPDPYVVASAPVGTDAHRYGTLTVLRVESLGGFDSGECAWLTAFGNELARALAALAERGVRIVPDHTPVLVPILTAGPADGTPGSAVWGAPGVPGSPGLSMMYTVRRLTEVLNAATTMEHVMAAAETCLMAPLHACSLVLASVEDGRMWILGHSGATPDMLSDLHGSRLHTGPPAKAVVTRRPYIVSGGADPGAAGPCPDGEAPDASVHLPLLGSSHPTSTPAPENDHIVGVCSLGFQGTHHFPPDERAILSMAAGLLGSAVERVELKKKRNALAEGLQKSLLPRMLSDLPQLTTTARYRPATATSQVGGDWYDVIKPPNGKVVLIVGDVEGHAIESAAVMGQIRSAMVAYAIEGHPPATIIDRTNSLLASLGTELLATCCVIAVDTTAGVAEVASAGHLEPLIRTLDGDVSVLDAPPNVPLGIVGESFPYRAREHALAPGSVLLLYSDGLADPSAPDPVAAVRTAFRASSRDAGHHLEAWADRLVAETSCPDHPDQHRDDTVLLLARYEGTGGDSLPRTGRMHIQRHDLRGVKEARTFVGDRLSAWGLKRMSDDFELVTSEVVTNALIHAGSDVEVFLRAFTDHVQLEVRDSDSNPPVPAPFSLSEEGSARAEHGRGLFIIDALAGAWNSSPNGRGKTVWLNLPIPEA